MARDYDLQHDTKYRENFIGDYKNFFLNYGSDLFFDPHMSDAFCSGVSRSREIRAAAEAAEAAIGHSEREINLEDLVTYVTIFSIDFLKEIIAKVKNADSVGHSIVQNLSEKKIHDPEMAKMDPVKVSAFFLVNLYAGADVFYGVDDDSPESLGDAYVEACGYNTARVMQSCTRTKIIETGKSKGNKAFTRQKTSTSGPKRVTNIDAESWNTVLQEMFKHMSDAIDELDCGEIDTLVRHTLNAFSIFRPTDMNYYQIKEAHDTLLSTKSLATEIQDSIKVWYEESYEEEESERALREKE